MNLRQLEAADVRRALDALGARRLVVALGLGEHAKPQPKGFIIRCPVHDDKDPSCSVQDKAGIVWRCFSCGARGDALALVAAVYRLSTSGSGFANVLRAGAEVAGVRLELDGAPRRPVRAPRSESEPQPLDAKTFDRLAALMLARSVEDDDEVRRYLDARGLLAQAIADGWSALPADHRALAARIVGELGREAWARSGLGHGDDVAHPEHRIVIPWRCPDRLVSTLQRRALDGRRGKYVFPSGHGARWPYGADRLSQLQAFGRPVLLVEGAADVLAVRELGEPLMPYTAIGVPGVTSWADEWTEALRGRLVVIGFDRDEAGQKAGKALAARLYQAGLRFADPWGVQPGSKCKDWGDWLRKRRNNAR